MSPTRAAWTASPSARSSGFALVLVLWVLAGLTVVAVAVASSVRVSSESVKLLRERAINEARFMSTAARIQVMASTGDAQRNTIESPRGRLFVDGRPHLVSPGEWVTIQDSRGLLDVNEPGLRIGGLLRRCGAPEDSISSLIDALADYIDVDGLKRLNGGEAFDYRVVRLPEPRNAKLLSREELWRVKGWQDIRAAWKATGCDDWVTVHGDARFNRNTAPMTMLVADGLTPEGATALIEARREGLPTLTLQSMGSDTANPFALLGGAFVGDTLRIRHQAASVEWVFEYELQLTAFSEGGPWRLHELRYPPRGAEVPAAAQALPSVDFETSVREKPGQNASPDLPLVK